jgi:energy-coupling factor transporter ATP-binding protein EcfA2
MSAVPNAGAASAVLQVRDVAKSFGGIHAVNGVSFDVHEGEILGLIGPNGSGKSTLFNCILGQLTPTAGEVRIDGKPITGKRPCELNRLGVGRKNGLIGCDEASRHPVEHSIGSPDFRGSQGARIPEVTDGVKYAQGLPRGVVEFGNVKTREHPRRSERHTQPQSRAEGGLVQRWRQVVGIRGGRVTTGIHAEVALLIVGKRPASMAS